MWGRCGWTKDSPRKEEYPPLVDVWQQFYGARKYIEPSSQSSPIETPTISSKEEIKESNEETSLKLVYQALQKSVALRTKTISSACWKNLNGKSAVSVLFSGGLDSALLAALLDQVLPIDMSVELVNVAFSPLPSNYKELPPPATQQQQKNKNNKPKLIEADFEVPDRLNARKAIVELE